MRLDGKTITVGVTGGIAVYKTCELISRLRKSGAAVYVVMTKNATEFVRPLTFETLSCNRVVVDTFDRDFEWEVEHVSLAKKSDLFVVAPCTANFLAKYNAGHCRRFFVYYDNGYALSGAAGTGNEYRYARKRRDSQKYFRSRKTRG